MLSPSAQSFPIVDHAKWLKLFGSWNAKRTRATTSIFDIPNDLLCDRLKNEIMTVPTTTSCLDTQQELEEKGRTCRACNLVFTGLYEQQQHFKTELHRMNLKQKLAGLESLVEIPADYHDVTSSGSSITGVKGVRFADVKGADESSSDEEEDLDFIYSEADYFEEAVQQDTAVGRYPTEYITNEGKARRFISKQDGPQYIFSSSRESLSPWDFTVSVGVLHEASSVSSFEVQPWTLLSEAVQKLQGTYQLYFSSL